MVTYDYHCQTCGHDFQIQERMSDHGGQAPPCPKCDAKDVRRVYGRTFVKTARKS